MPIIDLPHRPTVNNAPANADELATLLRDSADVQYNDRQSAEGGRCKMCGRKPPSDELYEIVLDPGQDERIRIGIGRCHAHHLVAAVRRLLAAEERGQHADRQVRMRRLQEALWHLG